MTRPTRKSNLIKSSPDKSGPHEPSGSLPSLSTPDLADAAPHARALELQFTGYGQRRAFGGQAVTVKCYEDNSLVKTAVEEPGAGRVLVVDGGGSRRRALLGDQLAAKAVANGWAGIVIHGVIRDVDEIDGMAIGVKALGSIPLKTDKRGIGERDVPLRIGGVDIAPGDWIYADNNGVLVSREQIAS